jgi:hypothetical protein
MDRIVPVFAMVASVTYLREILAFRHEGCRKASKVARAQGLQPSNDRAIFECRELCDCGLIKSGSGSERWATREVRWHYFLAINAVKPT